MKSLHYKISKRLFRLKSTFSAEVVRVRLFRISVGLTDILHIMIRLNFQVCDISRKTGSIGFLTVGIVFMDPFMRCLSPLYVGRRPKPSKRTHKSDPRPFLYIRKPSVAPSDFRSMSGGDRGTTLPLELEHTSRMAQNDFRTSSYMITELFGWCVSPYHPPYIGRRPNRTEFD